MNSSVLDYPKALSSILLTDLLNSPRLTQATKQALWAVSWLTNHGIGGQLPLIPVYLGKDGGLTV